MADAAIKPRKRRRWPLVAGALVVLVVALVLFAPTVGGWLAPGIIRGQSGQAVPGRLNAQGVSLSWLGGQHVRGLTLQAPDGSLVAKADLDVSRGLLPLLFGSRNLGRVTLSGAHAEIVRTAEGTNLDKAAVNPADAPNTNEPAKLPKGFAATISVKGLDATYTDKTVPGSPAVSLKNFDLAARIAAGEPLTLDASGVTRVGASGPEGSLKAKASVESWAAADGTITPDAARVDATVTASNFPTDLAGAFMPAGSKRSSLSGALGESLDLSVIVKGSMKEATASLDAKLARAAAAGEFGIRDGVLTATRPLAASVQGAALAELAPALREAQNGGESGSIDAPPGVSITLESLRMKLPAGGKPLDLNGASAKLSLRVEETTGKVRVAPNEPPQPFRAAPLTLTIASDDLSKGVSASGSTRLTLAGRPGGSVGFDLRTGGLVNADGSPIRGMPSRFEGQVKVEGVATAIAEPFVQALGLDLTHDVGPTLDLTAAAYVAPSQNASPLTHIDLTVKSQNLTASGTFRLDDHAFGTRDYGLKVELASAASVAGRFFGPESDWSVRPVENGGSLTLTLTDLNVPLADHKPQLDQAGGQLNIATAGYRLAKLNSPREAPVDVVGITFAGTLAPAKAPRMDFKTALARAGEKFDASAVYELPGLFEKNDDGSLTPRPAKVRPVGELNVSNAPTSLAGLFMTPQPSPGASAKPAGPARQNDTSAMDVPALIRAALGPTVSIVVTTAPGDTQLPADGKIAAEAPARWLRTTFNLTSPNASLSVKGGVSPRRLTLRETTGEVALSAALVEQLLNLMGPAAQKPRIDNAGKLSIGVAPITIPMQDWRPRLAQGGQLDVTLAIPGRTLASGLAISTTSGTRDLGSLGVEDFRLVAGLPLPAVFGPVQQTASATLSATLLGEGAKTAAKIDARAAGPIASGKPAGPADASISLTQINTQLLDPFVGAGQVLSGALGDSASLKVSTSLSPGDQKAASAATEIRVELAAPKVRTSGPLTIRVAPDRFALAGPAAFDMDLDPAFANALLEPTPRSGEPVRGYVSLKSPAKASLAINAFSVPRAGGPTPPPLEADASLDIARLDLVSVERAPGAPEQRRDVTLSGVKVTANTTGPGDQRVVDYHVRVATAAVAGSQPAKDMALDGGVHRLIGADGGFSLARATLSASGQLPTIPTALVDALASQEGMLVEALGPIVSVQLLGERLPLGGLDAPASPEGPASLNVAANSPRASVTLKGVIEGRAFRATDPLRATITEVTPRMSERLLKGIQVAQLEKKPGEDAPATLVGNDLTIPLDSDWSKFNGRFDVDPGEARFAASSIYARVLNIAKLRQSGQVGRRLGPLTVSVNRGVANYSRWTVPLGEFKLETEGSVDIVNKRLDIVTYIPFGALADEAAGKFNTGLGSLLGRTIPGLESATMIPFRTKGPFDNPSAAPDYDLFGRNFIDTVNPEDLLKRGLGGLEDLFNRKKKGNK